MRSANSQVWSVFGTEFSKSSTPIGMPSIKMLMHIATIYPRLPLQECFMGTGGILTATPWGELVGKELLLNFSTYHGVQGWAVIRIQEAYGKGSG